MGSLPEQWPRRWKCDSEEEGEQHPAGKEFKERVHQLHRRERDMRSQFGHLVGDEKHDGEELTVDGGRCSRDPTWRLEVTTDDGDSWGKTIARSRRSAMRKELPNGGVKRWLTSALGKSCEKGEEASVTGSFYMRRRETVRR
jgi:hypothetical protein